MDIIRHQSVFDPTPLEGESFLVIGAGAVGSSVALGLAKLGIANISVMDFDSVEPHNLSNQYVYGPDDVGRLKTEALAEAIYRATGTQINQVFSAYEGERIFDSIVFMCVDTMTVRKMIMERGIHMNPYTKWVFDTRIDAYQTMSYAFRPRDLNEFASFADTLYDDRDVAEERGTCGNVLSIGATAQIASQITIWLAMQALTDKLTANEVIVQVQPQWNMLSRKF